MPMVPEARGPSMAYVTSRVPPLVQLDLRDAEDVVGHGSVPLRD
jgi:hypothetical protein